MAFKNEKGLSLSWIIYPEIEKYINKKFRKGETYMFEWNFKCLLLPGTYYTDSGIRCLINGEKVVLNKISDAFVFKVQDEDIRQRGGFFDSHQRLTMEIL
jgi:hypothetical protein